MEEAIQLLKEGMSKHEAAIIVALMKNRLKLLVPNVGLSNILKFSSQWSILTILNQ